MKGAQGLEEAVVGLVISRNDGAGSYYTWPIKGLSHTHASDHSTKVAVPLLGPRSVTSGDYVTQVTSTLKP